MELNRNLGFYILKTVELIIGKVTSRKLEIYRDFSKVKL